MSDSMILDRIKPLHIVIVCAAFIAVNILINYISVESKSLDIFNAAFEVSISAILSGLFLFLYITSKNNQYAFTRSIMWLGFALAAWTLGDALYLYHILINIDPFMSSVDIFYIAATLLVIASVLAIPGSQPPSRRRNMVFIEISILVLSATVIFTILLFAPGNPDLNFDPFTMFMIFIYPVLDIICIWIIMIMFFTYPVKNSQKVLGLMFIGVLFIFLSDLSYLINNLYTTLVSSYIVDMGYYFFYLFLMLAGFIGFKEIRERPTENEKLVATFKQGNWIVFLPGVFLITVIGLLLVFVLNHSFVLYQGIVILIAFVIALFFIHQYLVIIDNIKLTREMRLVNLELESKVEKRTTELSQANAELHEEMLEREKAEVHLASTNQELALVNREKDKLFSIMAHDLRSPLGSMMKLSELLVDNVKDFDENELLEVAVTLNKSASQTFQLLNDLLAWSAVQMGRSDRKKELFHISETIAENVALLTPEAAKKSISITADIDPELQVFADKFAILTVIRNLVNNAIKFTPNSGAIIVTAGQSKNFIKISVIDNGIGIPKEKQNRIFRIDAVSSSPGTEGEKGTGFGLLLCKDLIARNNGELWLESEKGKGSSFHFTLPEREGDSFVSHTKVKLAARIETNYVHSKKLAFTTLIGEFDPVILRSELSLLWSSSDYNPDYSALVDLRQASFTLDMKEFPEVLRIFASMPGNHINRKFGILTATPQQVAYSTMFGQNIKNKYPFNVEVFSTYEAAINWLGG
jgi:signal transduction histidine kinase